MKNPELSLVLPAYREGSHIEASLSRLRSILSGLKYSWEIVVVDDGSDDDTWPALVRVAQQQKSLRIIRLSRNFGKESALCAGLDAARGKAVILMDGDLQHPPELIPNFVEAWERGFLVVDGVKSDRGKESLGYGLLARIFYRVLSSATGINFSSASDYKLLDRRAIEVWKTLPERTLFFRGMVSWLGFPRKSITFEVAPRAAGRSSFGTLRLVKLAWAALTAYSAWPLHAITMAGVFFTLVSVLLLAQTILNKVWGIAFSGFTTVISLQLLIGSILILSIGVLGEYIAKIFEEVKGRPRYVIFEMKGEEQSDE